jgi:hypothetical protein
VDKDRLTEGSLGIGDEQLLLCDRKRESHRPAAVVLDAGEVVADDVVEYALARTHDGQQLQLLVTARFCIIEEQLGAVRVEML